MNCYRVKNANHGYDLVNVAWSDDRIVVRAFALYAGQIDENKVIDVPDLTEFTSDLDNKNLLAYSNQYYEVQSVFTMRRDYGQLQGSGTYIFYTLYDQKNVYAMRLDAEKYPDLVVNDWRWMENKGIHPILKFCLTSDNQNFIDASKVYYLNASNLESTVFLTKDTFTGDPTSDGQTRVIPVLSYTVSSNTIAFDANDPTVEGLLHFEHKKNIHLDDVVEMSNGYAIVNYSIVNPVNSFSFDALYGFTKVATITGED